MNGASACGSTTCSRKPWPSGSLARIDALSSTWPYTRWPPSRSPRRRLSSRLSRSPARSASKPVRRTVSGTTSKRIVRASKPTTVRHTPLHATESPGATPSATRLGRLDDQRQAAARVALERGDAAVVHDQAGEHDGQVRGEQHIVAERSMRSKRHPFAPARSAPGEHRHRALRAQKARRDEPDGALDEAGAPAAGRPASGRPRTARSRCRARAARAARRARSSARASPAAT